MQLSLGASPILATRFKNNKMERAKGTKEVNPEQKLIRNRILNVLVRTFELYGFQPLETPTLQRLDVLASKYAGGSEILKETFKLNDQGNRDLALRYDLTVPLAIYVALNPQVKLPFKRYEIGKVFRDGPVSSERFREFWQCDVDTVGSASMLADAEIVNLAIAVFSELKLKIIIKTNNRKILDCLMEYCGIPDNKTETAILTIDKLEKISAEGVKKELKEKGFEDIQISKLIKSISLKGTNKEKILKIKKILTNNKGVEEIEELLRYAPQAEFDPSLARGLAYYTGTVFEIFLKNSEIKSAVCSGGRYDKIIGNFIGNNQEYPAVGISFGLDRIEQALKFNEKTTTKVYIIPIKQMKKAAELAAELRRNKINTDIDLMNRGISKNLDFANTLEIPYVIFVGEDEVKKKKFKLRNMKTGKEEMLKISEIAKRLKK